MDYFWFEEMGLINFTIEKEVKEKEEVTAPSEATSSKLKG